MIRRIPPGSSPSSVISAHKASHQHADATAASGGPLADAHPHIPRLRPAPPRRRRRGHAGLSGLDDEVDFVDQEDAEAIRACALRGRVSVAISPSQGREQSQEDQHGGGGNTGGNATGTTYSDDAQVEPAQVEPLRSALPVELGQSVRACIDGVIERYATTRAVDTMARRYALVAAFVELRAISVAHPVSAPLTTMVWKLMREHLQIGSDNTAPEKLQTLRTRLMELVPADPEPTPALRNFHLLLPLILLNAEKPRRRVDRASAITRLDTLLTEHPERVAQEVRA